MDSLPWYLLALCIISHFIYRKKMAREIYELRGNIYDITVASMGEILWGISDYIPADVTVEDPQLKGNIYFNYTMGELVAHSRILHERVVALPSFEKLNHDEFTRLMDEFTHFKNAFDSIST